MNKKEFFRLLCCPACKGDIQLRANGTELYCPRCVFVFPIVDGIPVLFPCNVAIEMKSLFTRYWDSEEKARMYDSLVEGGDSIFGVYNHRSEVFGLTRYYDQDNLDLFLDAGCGNGRFFETLPEDTFSVGADASLHLLKTAQRRGRGNFHVCCELEHLPFQDGIFGTVISCRVLQHLIKQEEAVNELSRVTRDRGCIILELYNTWNPKTVYKNIRMSKYRKVFNYPFRLIFRSMSPFDDWPLAYDHYNNWFEVKRWLGKNNFHGIRGRGVGFGYHKYFLAPFYIDAVLSKKRPDFLRSYYAKCFAVEKAIGGFIPFRYVMEKFVIRGTKNAPELNQGIGSKVLRTIDYHLKSSFLWNSEAIKEAKREQHGRDVVIKDNRFHIGEAVEWLKRAQDAMSDRGVSRGYSVGWNFCYQAHGWQPSYPETTGYIIPTIFDCASYLNDGSLRTRAVEMADWEIDVQMPNGAVMGGTVHSLPSPAVFNTGQVILGWLRAYEETRQQKYLDACERAGKFLVSVQNDNGTWHKANSRFANPRATTYNSRVGWALILLGQKLHSPESLIRGEKSIEAAIREQNPNGWFRDNSLDNPEEPLLHTICYAIEGIWGAAEALENDRYYEKARLSADQLLFCVSDDGELPGRLDSAWKGIVNWNCLTGNAQGALIWLKLYERIGDLKYQTAARKVLRFLKTTQNCVSKDPGLRGGIKGSFPFGGGYGCYEVLNWATKFYIDALLLDERAPQ